MELIRKKLWTKLQKREAVRDISAVQNFAMEITELGVRLAVDDFVSGFSSFLYLRYFDCYFAKLEGSLVRDITRSGRSRMIVENMAKLVQRFSIEVVAEFVENREIAEIFIAQAYATVRAIIWECHRGALVTEVSTA